LLQRERVWFAEAIFVVLVLAGIYIVVGSYLLYRKPEQSEKWRYLILMDTVTSLFWIGGFLVGPTLCILAGAIAKHQSKKKTVQTET
jgi:MFS family permease